jgi:hypothetical protein
MLSCPVVAEGYLLNMPITCWNLTVRKQTVMRAGTEAMEAFLTTMTFPLVLILVILQLVVQAIKVQEIMV